MGEGTNPDETQRSFECSNWSALACEAKDCLRSSHGSTLQTEIDIEDLQFANLVDTKLACVVFGSNNEVCCQSAAFSALTGYDEAKLCSKVAWLESDREWLELAVNGTQRQNIEKLHESIFAAGITRKSQAVNIMIGCKRNGDPFWNLRHVFPIDCEGARYVVHVLVPLEVAIPGLLWPRSGEATELVIGPQMLETMLGKMHAIANEWVPGTDVPGNLTKTMLGACQALESTLADALEGDHFVPALGGTAVSNFENNVQWAQIYSSVESELKAVWAACDQQAYMTDATGRSVTVACAISDPTEPDCPLVYVSPGFETLTGYPHSFAHGRNCRFLQPNDKSRNLAFNGPELTRMREFCTQKRSGQIFNLLLNESRSGEPFWNLLYMKHLNFGKKRHYILGLQTNIELQKEMLDKMVPQEWTMEGIFLLQKLREILQVHEDGFSPSERSFVNLANEITGTWMMNFGQKLDSSWEGDLYCPMVGNGAVQEFAGKWPELADSCLKSILELNKIQVEVRRNGKTEMQVKDSRITDPDQVVCAVADPNSLDCPLVFISESFTEMTGYDKSFALGRNCRFLQPKCQDMNSALNGFECGRMKDFCVARHQVGDTILNLLLNERRTGERFWNLLHMTHVEGNGRRYILAVQTILDIPMPLLLKKAKLDHHLDADKVLNFANQLGSFLNKLRAYLQESLNAVSDVGKSAAYVFDRVMAFLKESCDDYAGDHYVPRLGRPDVDFFENSVTWAGLCHVLTGKNCPGLRDVPGIAFSVADLDGRDCPLVYVSDNFEEVTSYKQSYALGRNCRFLRTKNEQRDDLLNADELERLESFVSEGIDDAGDAQIFTLLLNEDRECHPAWCVNVSQCIAVAAGRRYLITVHTKISMQHKPEVNRRLVEILTFDDEARQERRRLRKCISIRQHSSPLNWELFPEIGTDWDAKGTLHQHYQRVHEMVESWARAFPKSMELPGTPSLGGKTLPFAALELGSDCVETEELIQQFATALSNGFRHIHLVFRNLSVKDEKLCDLEGRLFALRVAQIFAWLQKNMYLYIAENIVCSIRTPPYLLNGFSELRTALKSHRQSIAYWLLDLSGVSDNALSKSTTKVLQCWQTMSDAKVAGDVGEIGLFGGNDKIIESVRSAPGTQQMTIFATDMYPGKQFDHVLARCIQTLSSSGVKLLACNCFGGQHNKLLEQPTVVEAAKASQIDPAIMILRCLQAQGWMVLCPSTLQLQKDIFDRPEVKWNKQDLGLGGRAKDSLQVEPLPSIPKFTREFTRQFSMPSGITLEKLWSALGWAGVVLNDDDAGAASPSNRNSKGKKGADRERINRRHRTMILDHTKFLPDTGAEAAAGDGLDQAPRSTTLPSLSTRSGSARPDSAESLRVQSAASMYSAQDSDDDGSPSEWRLSNKMRVLFPDESRRASDPTSRSPSNSGWNASAPQTPRSGNRASSNTHRDLAPLGKGALLGQRRQGGRSKTLGPNRLGSWGMQPEKFSKPETEEAEAASESPKSAAGVLVQRAKQTLRSASRAASRVQQAKQDDASPAAEAVPTATKFTPASPSKDAPKPQRQFRRSCTTKMA
mmetsp:Transcript_18112/g.33694  ORF Transcript_18112/g.33694 Transcript_18112/m.33694 type:complete len:1568 (+) Transcript_18112:70-4773(+)